MRYFYPQVRPETARAAREIVKRKYGRDLTEAEAAEMMERLVRFLYLSAHPEEWNPPLCEEVPAHPLPPRKSRAGKPLSRSKRTS